MTAAPATRVLTADASDRGGGGVPCRRWAGRLPDRDRLRARRRRPQWRGGRPPLCRQRPAELQSADRPCREPRRRAPARALRCRRRETRRRVLAGAIDAGAAEAAGRRGRRPRARRARQRGGARAGASSGACPFGGVRRPGGGAVGQPLRPCFADERRACARRSARAHRHGDRRRPLPGRRRIHHRRLPRRAGAAAPRWIAAREDRSARSGSRWRSPHSATRRRFRPACCRRIMRPRRGCGLTPRRRATDEALLAFGPAPKAGVSLNLSPRGDLIEAAANLFSHLRTLDASGAKCIAVMKVPRQGLGEAINDRLQRAAAPRT